MIRQIFAQHQELLIGKLSGTSSTSHTAWAEGLDPGKSQAPLTYHRLLKIPTTPPGSSPPGLKFTLLCGQPSFVTMRCRMYLPKPTEILMEHLMGAGMYLSHPPAEIPNGPDELRCLQGASMSCQGGCWLHTTFGVGCTQYLVLLTSECVLIISHHPC